jgi:hypothetical protein
MARAAGLAAFCYWHYWFGDGRELLNRPIDEVAATGEPNFPLSSLMVVTLSVEASSRPSSLSTRHTS